MSNFKNLDYVGFDVESNIKYLDDRIGRIRNSEYYGKLLDSLIEYHKECLFDASDAKHIMWQMTGLYNQSYRGYGFQTDNECDKGWEFYNILRLLDFIESSVYNTVDDGSMYIIKIMTNEREFLHNNNWEKTDNYLVGFYFWDMEIHDGKQLGKQIFKKLEMEFSNIGINGGFYRSDTIRVQVKYLGLDDLVKIINSIVKFSKEKRNAIHEFCNKHQIQLDDYWKDIDNRCNFNDEYPQYSDYDITDMFSNWRTYIYDFENFDLKEDKT